MPDEPELGFVERYVSEAFSLIEHPMAPGVLGSPIHTHSREDELSYVVHGTVQVQVGDRIITAGPRDVIWKPRGVAHAFWNPGPQPALVLELIIPGGFERYFRELVALARESNGSPDREQMKEVQQRYGLDMDASSIQTLMERYHVRPPKM
jgi:mannose-6-phosphate isomerase-like protein (cupin superfamily)